MRTECCACSTPRPALSLPTIAMTKPKRSSKRRAAITSSANQGDCSHPAANMPHTCPACNYPGLHESPRARDGGASYEICPSCGFQFGVDDDDRGVTPAQWRERWVKNGMKWSSQGIPRPDGWNPEKQLKALRSPP